MIIMAMLLYTVAGILSEIFYFSLVKIGSATGLTHSTWAMASFFDKSKVFSYVKSLFAYFLGIITLPFLTFLPAVVIDYFK